jgi:hypothetical protein
VLFLLVVPWSLEAQLEDHPRSDESCPSFVQRFYNWYLPKTLQKNEGQDWDLALRSKKYTFDPNLSRGLKQSELRASAEKDAGLDMDPFLNSQDPADSYIVGKFTQKGSRCRVEVYGIFSGKKSAKPSVVPEVVFRNDRWVFVNFHYPGDGPGSKDLMTLISNYLGPGGQLAK